MQGGQINKILDGRAIQLLQFGKRAAGRIRPGGRRLPTPGLRAQFFISTTSHRALKSYWPILQRCWLQWWLNAS